MAIFKLEIRVTGHLCGETTGHRWIPLTNASDAELWCFFNLHLNTRLSKQSWRRFETPSPSLWRHCNACLKSLIRGSRHSTRGAESACCISGDWTLRKLLTVRMQNASSLSFLVDKQCHVYLNRDYVYRLLLNFSSESSFVRYCWDIFHAQQFAQPAIGLGHEDINSIWNNGCKYLSMPKSLLISVNCSSIYYIDRSRFYLWESGNGECALWTATVKPTQHLADTHSGWPTELLVCLMLLVYLRMVRCFYAYSNTGSPSLEHRS